MDALLSILMIAALVALGSSNRKKQARKASARRNNGHAEANESIRLAQQKMPLSKEDWITFLKEQSQSMPQSPKKKVISKAEHTSQSSKKASTPKRERNKAAKAAPQKNAAPLPFEGSISTQGESAAEHAVHMAKIHSEEEKLRQQEQTLRQIRNLNQQKLREAVIMSEVLGKPVSLRSHTYR